MRRISVPLGGHVSPDTGGRLRVALPSRCPCGAVSQRPVARRRSPLAKQRRGFPSSSASCSQAAVSPMSRLTALHEQWKRERLQETASGGRKETGTDPSERGETAPRFFSTSASDLSRASDESDSFSLEHFERRGLRASPEREPWHLSQSALQKLSAKILFLNMWMDQRRSRNRTRRKSLEGGEEDRDGDRDGALQSASCRSPVEGGVVPADLSAQEERRVLEALTHSARELSVQTPVRFVVLLSQVANTRVNPRRVESAELHGRMLESIFSSVTDGSRRAVGGEGTRSVFESLSTQDRLSLCRTLLSVLSKRHLEEKPPSEAEIAALSAIMDSFVQSLKKERKGEKGGVESSSASSVTSLALLCALAARVESRLSQQKVRLKEFEGLPLAERGEGSQKKFCCWSDSLASAFVKTLDRNELVVESREGLKKVAFPLSPLSSELNVSSSSPSVSLPGATLPVWRGQKEDCVEALRALVFSASSIGFALAERASSSFDMAAREKGGGLQRRHLPSPSSFDHPPASPSGSCHSPFLSLSPRLFPTDVDLRLMKTWLRLLNDDKCGLLNPTLTKAPSSPSLSSLSRKGPRGPGGRGPPPATPLLPTPSPPAPSFPSRQPCEAPSGPPSVVEMDSGGERSFVEIQSQKKEGGRERDGVTDSTPEQHQTCRLPFSSFSSSPPPLPFYSLAALLFSLYRLGRVTLQLGRDMPLHCGVQQQSDQGGALCDDVRASAEKAALRLLNVTGKALEEARRRKQEAGEGSVSLLSCLAGWGAAVGRKDGEATDAKENEKIGFDVVKVAIAFGMFYARPFSSGFRGLGVQNLPDGSGWAWRPSFETRTAFLEAVGEAVGSRDLSIEQEMQVFQSLTRMQFDAKDPTVDALIRRLAGHVGLMGTHTAASALEILSKMHGTPATKSTELQRQSAASSSNSSSAEFSGGALKRGGPEVLAHRIAWKVDQTLFRVRAWRDRTASTAASLRLADTELPSSSAEGERPESAIDEEEGHEEAERLRGEEREWRETERPTGEGGTGTGAFVDVEPVDAGAAARCITAWDLQRVVVALAKLKRLTPKKTDIYAPFLIRFIRDGAYNLSSLCSLACAFTGTGSVGVETVAFPVFSAIRVKVCEDLRDLRGEVQGDEEGDLSFSGNSRHRTLRDNATLLLGAFGHVRALDAGLVDVCLGWLEPLDKASLAEVNTVLMALGRVEILSPQRLLDLGAALERVVFEASAETLSESAEAVDGESHFSVETKGEQARRKGGSLQRQKEDQVQEHQKILSDFEATPSDRTDLASERKYLSTETSRALVQVLLQTAHLHTRLPALSLETRQRLRNLHTSAVRGLLLLQNQKACKTANRAQTLISLQSFHLLMPDPEPELQLEFLRLKLQREGKEREQGGQALQSRVHSQTLSPPSVRSPSSSSSTPFSPLPKSSSTLSALPYPLLRPVLSGVTSALTLEELRSHVDLHDWCRRDLHRFGNKFRKDVTTSAFQKAVAKGVRSLADDVERANPGLWLEVEQEVDIPSTVFSVDCVITTSLHKMKSTFMK